MIIDLVDAEFFGEFADLGFGVVANGKQDVFEFFLGEGVQEIALVFGGVFGGAKLVGGFFCRGSLIFGRGTFAALRCVPRIMAGSHIIRAEFAHFVEEEAEFYAAVAFDAGVGSYPLLVAFDEIVNDVVFKTVFEIEDVKWDAQLVGYAAGAVKAFKGAAFVLGKLGALFRGKKGRVVPETEMDADDFVALFYQEGGGD